MNLYRGIITKTFNTVDIAELLILWQVVTVLKHYQAYLKVLPREYSDF